MRLTTIILITAIMQVSASTYGQKITLSERNKPLVEVFDQISAQTGFDFLVSASILKDIKPVTINVKGMELNAVLDKLSEGKQLKYSIADKSVVVSKKEPSFLDNLVARFTDIDPRGKILDQNGAPLAGATVKLKGTNRAVITGKEGEFSLSNVPEDGVLVISYIGYIPLEISLKDAKMPLEIKLNIATGELQEVGITYNTGYQKLKPNEVTGSILHITKEQLQRSVSPNILDRLEGIAQGVLFDRRIPGKQDIQIRGRFTLGGLNQEESSGGGRTGKMAQPLIVLDNFPYEGNISDIDPNIVESIDILKDAAAASIWGAKAGNGVIVISTSKGKIDQKPDFSFSSNWSITQKPDINKAQYISSSDYIDLETFLFNQGYYDGEISNANEALTPVVDILSKMRSGMLNNSIGQAQIDALRFRDVRDDFMKYVYEKAISQQYSLNFSGGAKNITYSLSGSLVNGRNGGSMKKNDSRRLTFNSTTNYNLTNFVKLGLNLGYTSTIDQPNGIPGYGGYQIAERDLYPYARLVDEFGNPAIFEQNLKSEYYYNLGNGRLLDWNYRPLQELQLNDNTNLRKALNLGVTAEVKVSKDLWINFQYNFQNTAALNSVHHTKDSYFARNLINTFTNLTPTTIKYNVPNEGMLDRVGSDMLAHNIRAALNFTKSWKDSHSLNVLAGADVGQKVENAEGFLRLYGYSSYLSTALYDYFTPQPTIFGDSRPSNSFPFLRSTLTRTIGAYANVSYSYMGRYTVSGSARNDEANIFGVKTNQRGKPLWSAGLAWDITKENFYSIDAVPQLNFRLTYGHQGNYDPTGIANTVITYQPIAGVNNLPSASFIPPNPSLRWEVTKQWNMSLGFGLKNGRISGSIAYWNKKAKDIIAPAILDYTVGLSSKNINSANINGNGLDISLNMNNVYVDNFMWTTTYNFAYSKNMITKLLGSSNQRVRRGDGLFTPAIYVGYDPNTIISYRFSGLDPLTGKPLGVINGQVSDDFLQLNGASGDLTRLTIHGLGIPPYQGNVLNTVNYKRFSMSFNIRYALGFYFRRPGLHYGNLTAAGVKYSEYNLRWQRPGDELTTTVPSLLYPISNSDNFYTNSEVTVEKGNYFAINDLNFYYNLNNKIGERLPFKSMNIGIQLSNLNLFVYKASKRYDPLNYGNIPSPLITSFNIRASF